MSSDGHTWLSPAENVKYPQNAQTTASDVAGGADLAYATNEGTQNANFYFSVNLRDDYMTPCQLLHQDQAGSTLMVSFVLWNISLQERQERISPGRSRSDMAGVSGGSGRSGNWFRRIVFGEFRGEVGGEGGSLRCSRSGELFYGTDVVIGSLRRGTRPRMSLRLRTGNNGGGYTFGAGLYTLSSLRYKSWTKSTRDGKVRLSICIASRWIPGE